MLLAVLLMACCWAILPKTTEVRAVPENGNFTRLKYRGMGITESIGIFGVIPIEFTFPTFQTYPDLIARSEGITIVLLREQIWEKKGHWKGTFAGYFKTGEKRFEGTGEFYCKFRRPNISFVRIFDATFYKPDGSVDSRIAGGYGIETVWSEDGVKLEETLYQNGRWR